MYLTLENIAFSYPKSEKATLKNFNLAIGKGDSIGLVGASGCGKSTLLRLIAGLETLAAGSITLDGQLLSSPKVSVLPENRHIGMVFQNHCLFPHMTVRNNIAYGIRQRLHKKERVNEMLALIEMQSHADRYPYQLSGGQQQRVALARALAPRPQLLLLDEPFASLDAHLRLQLAQDVRALLENEGVSAIMVTHDQAEAFAFADVLGVLQNGELAQWANPYDVYHQPASRAVAEFVGQGAWVHGQVMDAHTVTLPLGQYVSERAHGFALGATLDVLLRPDDVVHVEDASLQARVLDKSFRGSDFMYQLALPCGQTVLAQVASHHRHAVGEWIGVQLDLNHLIAFESL